MVEFMYSGVVEVSGGDVADVLNAAEFLELPFAYGAVVAYLLTQISASTWADVRALGDRFVKPELSGAATEWAAAHFGQAAGDARAWRAVPRAWVEELLAREDLGCNDEDDVLAAALVWADGAEGRAAGLPALLNLVRLPHISAAKAWRLSLHPTVAGSLACMALMRECDPGTQEGDFALRHSPQRTCFTQACRLMVIDEDGVTFQYDVLSARWTVLPQLPPCEGNRITTFSTGATLNEFLYFTGTKHEPDEFYHRFLEVVRYDPLTGICTSLTPTDRTEEFRVTCSLDGFLYFGGDRRWARYSPRSSTWEEFTPNLIVSDHHDYQLVGMGGALYVIGGMVEIEHDECRELTATVARFTPDTNEWAFVTPMNVARYDHAVAVVDSALYVAGGWGLGVGVLSGSCSKMLSSCERYDAAANAWSRIADLPQPRVGIALACLRGSLYAFGGRIFVSETDDDGNCTRTSFPSPSPPWRYDAAADAWITAPLAAESAASPDFCSGRNGFCAH